MTKAVEDLLVSAKALLEQGENEALRGAIEKLEALGEDAKGSTQEFKDLKEIVAEINTKNGAGSDEQNKDKTPKGSDVSVKLGVRYADKKPGDKVKVSAKEAKRLIDNGFAVKA